MRLMPHAPSRRKMNSPTVCATVRLRSKPKCVEAPMSAAGGQSLAPRLHELAIAERRNSLSRMGTGDGGHGRGPTIEAIDVATYVVPTDAPESDGTLEWDRTTLVVV